MNIIYYKNAAEFLSHTGKYLAKDEAHYGLIFSLAKRLVENPHWYGQVDPWFCSVKEKGLLNTIAMRTPPFKPVLAYFSGSMEAIAAQLVGSIATKDKAIPGVSGDKELTDCFVDLWRREHGAKILSKMAQRIYRLDKVNNVPLSQGRLRPAMIADKDLAAKWWHGFNIDTFGNNRNIPEGDISPALASGGLFFWDDGKPVSMAQKTRPTDKGMTVAYVYTPPELRGRGYATSCVAELSRNILQSGYQFCTLYTDLANPTSNSIYKKIGYREVCDSVEYNFEI
jgi:predicted GNAT family acetyltransferase